MRFRALACACLLSVGCQELEEGGPPDVASAAGNGADASAFEASRPEASVDAPPDVPPDTARIRCPETTPVPPSDDARIELAVEPVLGGKPFAFGQRNELPSGAAVTPLNFRFYLAHLALLRANGPAVWAPMITAAGAPAPYDVHLFNAEDPESSTVRLAAPAGDYTGIELVFGIDDDCNVATLGNLKPPLSAASQMSWPHVAGYLFLRFEGRVEPASSRTADSAPTDSGPTDAGFDEQVPAAIHMGGSLGPDFGGQRVISAPRVQVRGDLRLDRAAPAHRTLRVVMDEIVRGAKADVDLTDFFGFPSPETNAGERLRRSVPMLTIFELVP